MHPDVTALLAAKKGGDHFHQAESKRSVQAESRLVFDEKYRYSCTSK